MVLHLNNEEVEQVLSMNHCISAMEVAFKDFANGLAVNRPRSHSYIPLEDEKFYLFKSMDGGLPQLGVHALRISSDILYEQFAAVAAVIYKAALTKGLGRNLSDDLFLETVHP